MTENNGRFDQRLLEEEALNSGNELEREESRLIIHDKVVAKIAKIALNSVDGILEMKGNIANSIGSRFSGREDQSTAGVSVEVGKKECKVYIDVVIEYGKNATRIFEDIKKAVSQNVNEMTGLTVVTINVDVVDVMTKREYESRRAGRENTEDTNSYSNY